MTSVDVILIFCVGVHVGLDTPSPVHMHPPEPDPLRVDVINGFLFTIHHRAYRNFTPFGLGAENYSPSREGVLEI